MLAGVQLFTVAESKFRDEVHAAIALEGQVYYGLGPEGVLVASIGRRLVSFRFFDRRQLRRLHLFPTHEPITYLSAHLTEGELPVHLHTPHTTPKQGPDSQ